MNGWTDEVPRLASGSPATGAWQCREDRLDARTPSRYVLAGARVEPVTRRRSRHEAGRYRRPQALARGPFCQRDVGTPFDTLERIPNAREWTDRVPGQRRLRTRFRPAGRFR